MMKALVLFLEIACSSGLGNAIPNDDAVLIQTHTMPAISGIAGDDRRKQLLAWIWSVTADGNIFSIPANWSKHETGQWWNFTGHQDYDTLQGHKFRREKYVTHFPAEIQKSTPAELKQLLWNNMHEGATGFKISTTRDNKTCYTRTEHSHYYDDSIKPWDPKRYAEELQPAMKLAMMAGNIIQVNNSLHHRGQSEHKETDLEKTLWKEGKESSMKELEPACLSGAARCMFDGTLRKLNQTTPFLVTVMAIQSMIIWTSDPKTEIVKEEIAPAKSPKFYPGSEAIEKMITGECWEWWSNCTKGFHLFFDRTNKKCEESLALLQKVVRGKKNVTNYDHSETIKRGKIASDRMKALRKNMKKGL